MEKLFVEMRTLKVEGRYKGPVVMIWYWEPQDKEDTVNVLIGLEIMPGEPVPEHFDTERIEMNGVVRATIVGHSSVMPSPAKVIEKIKRFASENNYKLQDLIIDKYLSDSVVFTEIPVKI
jgi:hypothetical protein